MGGIIPSPKSGGPIPLSPPPAPTPMNDGGVDGDYGDCGVSLYYSYACSAVVLGAARRRLQSAEFAHCPQQVRLHSKVATEQSSTPCSLSGRLHRAAARHFR